MTMKKYQVAADANSKIGAVACSDYVDAHVLAANTPESFTVPTDARFVRLSTNALFYYNPYNAAAVPSVDVTDGSASTMVPAASSTPVMCIDGVTAISVISPTTAIITAEWFS